MTCTLFLLWYSTTVHVLNSVVPKHSAMATTSQKPAVPDSTQCQLINPVPSRMDAGLPVSVCDRVYYCITIELPFHLALAVTRPYEYR